MGNVQSPLQDKDKGNRVADAMPPAKTKETVAPRERRSPMKKKTTVEASAAMDRSTKDDAVRVKKDAVRVKKDAVRVKKDAVKVNTNREAAVVPMSSFAPGRAVAPSMPSSYVYSSGVVARIGPDGSGVAHRWVDDNGRRTTASFRIRPSR